MAQAQSYVEIVSHMWEETPTYKKKAKLNR